MKFLTEDGEIMEGMILSDEEIALIQEFKDNTFDLHTGYLNSRDKTRLALEFMKRFKALYCKPTPFQKLETLREHLTTEVIVDE